MTQLIEELFAITIITFPLSLIIGLVISRLVKSNIETREKADKLFFNSTAGGFIGGLIGGLIGHHLGSESALNVDGLFGGLSAIGAVTNYFQVFLPCWIFSIFAGAALAINFPNQDEH